VKRASSFARPSRVLCALVAALLVLSMPAAVLAQVSPAEVKADLTPGESMTVDKTVTTPEIPPKPDIYFLTDSTGSMGGTIAAVKANAGAIMTDIQAVQPDAQFGVGNYKDFPYDSYCFQNQLNITDNTTDVQTAINAWTAFGGWDGPEGQLYALQQLADPGPVWRTGSTKIVVWFGDAPGHDPIPTAATGFTSDLTEASVTSALVAAGVKVIAIRLTTGYVDGTDGDPHLGGGDYSTHYGVAEDGTAGQASRIAAATGGVSLSNVSPDEVVDKILEGLSNLPAEVTWQVHPCAGLDVTLTPASQTVTSGEDATFTETIVVAADAPQCNTIDCEVEFFVNGVSDSVETISIHVKDVTPPKVSCVESVNPAGKKIPPAGTTLPGTKGGTNPDGFYKLLATDNCDPNPKIYVAGFGPFASGDVVKITQAPGAVPSMKKIGGTGADAVLVHITLPKDPVCTAVDASGNSASCNCCLVPPPPK
jgi:hypothetical protein